MRPVKSLYRIYRDVRFSRTNHPINPIKNFTDQEVLSPDFLKLLTDNFRRMRPFLDYMSEILGADANGELSGRG